MTTKVMTKITTKVMTGLMVALTVEMKSMLKRMRKKGMIGMISKRWMMMITMMMIQKMCIKIWKRKNRVVQMKTKNRTMKAIFSYQ